MRAIRKISGVSKRESKRADKAERKMTAQAKLDRSIKHNRKHNPGRFG